MAAVFDGLNTLRKNNTGYDLKHLFIGAEGTLGVITAVALRLMPQPTVREIALLSVPNPEAALALLSKARELSGDLLLAYELLPRYSIELALKHIDGVVDPLDQPSPWYVLMEMATSSVLGDLGGKLERIVSDAMDEGLVNDGVIAQSEAQRTQLWRPREEQAEAGRRAGPAVSCDLSVAVSRVPEFLTAARTALEGVLPGVELNTFGHMGDGNIHYSARKPASMSSEDWQQHAAPLGSRLHEVVAAFSGSFSAEHGIGSQKRSQLAAYAQGPRLGLMQAIKKAVDPDGMMNPGKIF